MSSQDTARSAKPKASPASDYLEFEREYQAFVTRFPTDEVCINEFCKHTGINMSLCPDCGHDQLEKIAEGRAGKCKRCRKKTWFTAGTFLHGVRLAQKWLAAIWLYAKGLRFNSHMFAKVASVAYDTAWKTTKKVALLIEDHLHELADYAPSADFLDVIFRRTCLTPAGKHPRHEEFDLQESRGPGEETQFGWSANSAQHGSCQARNYGQNDTPSATAHSNSDIQVTIYEEGFSLGEREKSVHHLLSAQPMHFDTLCRLSAISAAEMAVSITMLELSGKIERLPGELYQLRRTSSFSFRNKSSRKPADNIPGAGTPIEFIKQTFHGVGRKYVQLYLALHWCWLDRKRWTIETLLKECLKQGKIGNDRIRDYVSPPMVRYCPAREPPRIARSKQLPTISA